MATPAWQPGTIYLPGALVVPRTTPPLSPVVLQNPGFETGNGTGWTFTGSAPSFSKLHPAQGVYSCTFYTNAGDPTATFQGLNNEQPVCAQGVLINASARIKLATQGVASARVVLVWLDAGNAEISRSEGTLLERPTANDGNYVTATVTGVAPASTASVRLGVTGSVGNGGDVRVDAFDWDYDTAAPIQGLIYKAVQAGSGTSASTEPTWPQTLGVTVVDNTVTWEAVAISRIVWQPQAAMVSGATEPTWPTTTLERVKDGQIAWEAVSRRIEDANCPHSKIVVIAASKVYAADDDVVRYSATVNPLDWSTANDAGYLPYGLQQYGANPIAAMGLYRSNVVIFNANAFQMWQVDEDPANSALLDALPIGSTWHKALAPVSNDLFFNSAQGVRTVSIAGGSTNLAAGDVGMPIDPLVQDAMRVATANQTKALATYYPSAGQYWLAFSDYPAPTLTIVGDMPDGYVDGTVSGAYAVTGGVLPHGSVTVTAGTFPPGLTLNANGSYSGTYSAAGDYTWTVTVTDADGNTASVTDSATVTRLRWYLLRDGTANVWSTSDITAGSWTATTRTPALPLGYVDPIQVTTGRAIFRPRIVDVTDLFATSDLDGVISGVQSTAMFYTLAVRVSTDGIVTACREDQHSAFWYSTDYGATFTSNTIPANSYAAGVPVKVGNRWVIGIRSDTNTIKAGWTDSALPNIAASAWNQVALPYSATASRPGCLLSNGSKAFLAHTGGRIMSTENGADWAVVYNHGAAFADLRDTGIATGNVVAFVPDQAGNILISSDGGATFVSRYTGVVDVVVALSFANGVLVASYSASTTPPRYSTDYGATWAAVPGIPFSSGTYGIGALIG